MGISQFIRDIGRGKEGLRSLTVAQAHDLMDEVLHGRASDLETGAFVMAMRMKGETADELEGFLQAAQSHCLPIGAIRPTIVLPSYNGARKLPNLTALLALLLAQEGINVLVHGPSDEGSRTGTADIFRHLGLPCAHDADEAANSWSRRDPVFLPIEHWCPPLARLLQVRSVIGLRNSGHMVAKLLAPAGHGVMRVINHTHPEFAVLTAALVANAHMDAMLLRGTEGEPVADPRRQPQMTVCLRGTVCPPLCVPAHEGVLTELPVLPREIDAASTAHYIQSVVSGEKPAPTPIRQQVESLVKALAAVAALPHQPARERIA
jgi:anthranilate phosphoribosyltransferase